MKTLKFKGTEVSLSFDSYQNNGTLAVLMNTVPDDELYGVITVNLGSLLRPTAWRSLTRTTCRASEPGSGRTRSRPRWATRSAAGSASTSSTLSTNTRRVASNEALNLQVSNGLEILVSIGSRLTFNIRSVSAVKFGEVHRDFTEAAMLAENPFSFDQVFICH